MLDFIIRILCKINNLIKFVSYLYLDLSKDMAFVFGICMSVLLFIGLVKKDIGL